MKIYHFFIFNFISRHFHFRSRRKTAVGPTFITSTTFVTAHDFCQFKSSTFVSLTSFVNSELTSFVTNINHLCRYGRGHYFCQPVRPLLSPANVVYFLRSARPYSIIFMCVRACVRAGGRAGGRACVRACKLSCSTCANNAMKIFTLTK